jgi:transposase InsO family protein
VWDAIKTTFFDENDGTQIYELQMRVRGYTQSGGSLEEYYNTLQRLWREIDIRRPNKNVCSTDIENRNQEILEERLYIFLGGLDQRLDNIRAEILRTKPFPIIEEAFARVRREDVRQTVMTGRADNSNPMAMIARDRYPPVWQSGISLASKSGISHSLEPVTQTPEGGTITHSTLGSYSTYPNLAHGSGLAQMCVPEQQESIANYAARQQLNSGLSKVTKCTKCGSKKHTIEQCFQVIGYPEWWYELKKKKQGEKGKAKANLVMTDKTDNDSKSNEGENLYSCSYGKDSTWVIDSGATDHMTFSSDDVTNYTKPRKTEILNANGIPYPVSAAGDVHLSPSLTLSNTLVVPSLSTKLISVGQLAEDLNCMVLMYPNCCVFQDISTKEIIGRGIKRGRLYHLEDLKCGRANLAKGHSQPETKIWEWHRRLGHPSFGYLKKLLPKLFIDTDISLLNCETCIKAKSHRVSFKPSLNKCISPFELIHSDVWGPSPVNSIGGYRWFVLFIDDCTRMTWVYLLKRKEEVAEVFKVFFTMIQNQYEKNIKMVRSDNGGEFVNKVLQDFFVRKGIVHETSCVGTPQQNGIAERKNRHILETARALLIDYSVPQKFWDCAVLMAVYVLNRLPSKITDFNTPLKTLATFVTIPSVLSLPPKTFGCVAYVHVPKNQRSKLDPCAIRCVSLGLGMNQKGYKFYEPVNRKWYTTMDVTFVENESFFRSTQHSAQRENLNEEPLSWENPTNWFSTPVSVPSVPSNSLHDTTSTILHQIRETSPTHDGQLESTQEMQPDVIVQSETSIQVYNRDKNRQLFSNTVNREEEQHDDTTVWTEINGEAEELIQTDLRPHSPRSPEECPTVSSHNSVYVLPPRRNRGIPAKK